MVLALIIVAVAGLGVAGAVSMTRRSLNSRPGGLRLFVQTQNIKLGHRLGLLDDVEAAAAYGALRRHYRSLLHPKPVSLSGRPQVDNVMVYSGPFQREMTKKEARLILGLPEDQANDPRILIKQWRTLMLKNHPDMGGSPFLASRINEAKEILAGEKPAKEDLEEGGPGAPQGASAAGQDGLDPGSVAPSTPDDQVMYASVPEGPPGGGVPYSSQDSEFGALGGTLRDIQDIFHRKANRKRPLPSREEIEPFAPDEVWKRRYLQELFDQEREGEIISRAREHVVVHPGTGSTANKPEYAGMVCDADGRPVDPFRRRFKAEAKLFDEAAEEAAVAADGGPGDDHEQDWVTRIIAERILVDQKMGRRRGKRRDSEGI